MNEVARERVGAAGAEQEDLRQEPEEAQGGQFARHFLEMAVAMMAGMPLWHMFFGLVIRPAGFADEVSASPELWYGLMTFFMSAPMLVFMRYRKHGWGRSLEMVAAMAVPVALVLLLSRLGVGSNVTIFAGRGLSMSTHAAMYLGMFLAMLVRRDEYSQPQEPKAQTPGSAGMG
jgi:flagellar biosynthetic protein FliP